MRILATLAFTAALASGQSYVQDVFPIWEKHCLGCHASGTAMGSLDLETWEGLQRGGNHGTIVVPGDLKASRLYTMLTGETKPAMPMDGKVLSAAEIDTVRKWIAAGAPPPSAAEIADLRRRAASEEKPVSRSGPLARLPWPDSLLLSYCREIHVAPSWAGPLARLHGQQMTYAYASWAAPPAAGATRHLCGPGTLLAPDHWQFLASER